MYVESDWSQVYPRVCGGTSRIRSPSSVPGKRSIPRVCGGTQSTGRTTRSESSTRSIPACAGEPKASATIAKLWAVYPACAGEPIPITVSSWEIMVYPRVCGGTSSYDIRDTASFHSRSIPACAGEPKPVYSRLAIPIRGLSPRVRGNLVLHARATPGVSGVYPRVCGGTILEEALNLFAIGLSPRVRGNRLFALCTFLENGLSPRVRGNPSTSAIGAVGQRSGLSPRVRGNRYGFRIGVYPCRSIPACAGEPRDGDAGASQQRVYPRVCGGTYDRHRTTRLRRGLSPRVRGNPNLRGGGSYGLGSIPACAGEPIMEAWEPVAYTTGLSPRVRGNPERS